MDHARYRFLLGADPNSQDPELLAHRAECEDCARYTLQLLGFEARLQRALKVDIAPRAQVLPFATKAPRRTAPWRSLALAASVLLGLVIVGGVWLIVPERALAAAVVNHMAEEPDAWRRTDVAVPDPALYAVLDQSKLRLKPDAGMVSYASSCDFRGHHVPHLVVQTAAGPVTVMVLVHEPLRKPMDFDEKGYRGTLVPMAHHGSIAVLMKEPGSSRAEVQRIAAQVSGAIVWQP